MYVPDKLKLGLIPDDRTDERLARRNALDAEANRGTAWTAAAIALVGQCSLVELDGNLADIGDVCRAWLANSKGLYYGGMRRFRRARDSSKQTTKPYPAAKANRSVAFRPATPQMTAEALKHRHLFQEEIILVLSGEGVLLHADRRVAVRPME